MRYDPTVQQALRELHRLIVETTLDLRLELLARALKANFNPNQPRVPAGNPDGGQWTRVSGPSALHPVQARPRSRLPSYTFERILAEGGRKLGRFGSRVTIAVTCGVTDQESYNPDTGATTISLSGVGSAVIVEEFADEAVSSTYEVGTPKNPDGGLSIVIDADDNVTVRRTAGC